MIFRWKNKLIRKERRLLERMKSPKLYKTILWIVFLVFGFKKKFLVFWNKKSKKLWLISVTSNYFLWRKVSYLDDFIVNKKARGKWVWKGLFTKALDETKWTWKSDYIFLLSKKDRKKSHWIYKKFWFSLVSLWIGYLAYKKMKK